MKITKITRQKKNQERVSIYLDEKYAFSLSEENLIKLHLKEGQDVDEEAISRIAREEEDRRALDYVLRLIAIRSRSERELVQRLQQKRFSPESAGHALLRIKELGYVNDAQFARDWVRYRQEQGKGPQLIKAELKAKGVTPEILSDVLSEMKESPESETDRIQAIAGRKLKLMKGLPPREAAQRLTGFLVRRGFSLEAIREALRALRVAEDENGD